MQCWKYSEKDVKKDAKANIVATPKSGQHLQYIDVDAEVKYVKKDARAPVVAKPIDVEEVKEDDKAPVVANPVVKGPLQESWQRWQDLRQVKNR